MKKIRKALALILSGVLLLSTAACSGGENNSSQSAGQATDKSESKPAEAQKSVGMTKEEADAADPIKIGVAISSLTAEYLGVQDFLNNYVASQYNVEFMYSESLKTLEDEVAFLENCVASGCKGFMSFLSNDCEQIADRCAQNDMYYVANIQYAPQDYPELFANEAFAGGIGVGNAGKAEKYAQAINEFVSDGEEHGILICSGLAPVGNEQHTECGVAVLESVAEAYGLTYENEDLVSVIQSAATLDVKNDKNINICIYPGLSTTQEGWLSGFSALLMSEKYDIVINATTLYTQLFTIISDAESAMKKDIKVASMAVVGSDLESAMGDPDNLLLNAAVIKPGTWVPGSMFAALYNACTGYSLRTPENNAINVSANSWLAMSTEEMKVINQLDLIGENSSWVMQEEDLSKLTGVTNPDITAESFKELYENCDLTDIISR